MYLENLFVIIFVSLFILYRGCMWSIKCKMSILPLNHRTNLCAIERSRIAPNAGRMSIRVALRLAVSINRMSGHLCHTRTLAFVTCFISHVVRNYIIFPLQLTVVTSARQMKGWKVMRNAPERSNWVFEFWTLKHLYRILYRAHRIHSCRASKHMFLKLLHLIKRIVHILIITVI